MLSSSAKLGLIRVLALRSHGNTARESLVDSQCSLNSKSEEARKPHPLSALVSGEQKPKLFRERGSDGCLWDSFPATLHNVAVKPMAVVPQANAAVCAQHLLKGRRFGDHMDYDRQAIRTGGAVGLCHWPFAPLMMRHQSGGALQDLETPLRGQYLV